jgi:hypothetical protein
MLAYCRYAECRREHDCMKPIVSLLLRPATPHRLYDQGWRDCRSLVPRLARPQTDERLPRATCVSPAKLKVSAWTEGLKYCDHSLLGPAFTVAPTGEPWRAGFRVSLWYMNSQFTEHSPCSAYQPLTCLKWTVYSCLRCSVAFTLYSLVIQPVVQSGGLIVHIMQPIVKPVVQPIA